MSQVDEIEALLGQLGGDAGIEIERIGEDQLYLPLGSAVDLLLRVHEVTLAEAIRIAEDHAGMYNPDGAGYEAGYKSASVDIARALHELELDALAQGDLPV